MNQAEAHMTILSNIPARMRAGLLAVGAGCAIGLWAVTPARTLSDTKQILSGGGFATQGATMFTAPGIPFAHLAADLGGKGESAVSIRMQAGTLSGLKVKVTSQTTPTGGSLAFMVRKNGANTTITCTVSGAASNCQSNNSVVFANDDRLSVRNVNTLTGATTTKFTYTLLFD
jgi:hypothetical protein